MAANLRGSKSHGGPAVTEVKQQMDFWPGSAQRIDPVGGVASLAAAHKQEHG